MTSAEKMDSRRSLSSNVLVEGRNPGNTGRAAREGPGQPLKLYDTERLHQGYRNMGRRPTVTVRKFIQSVRKDA